MYEQLQAVPAVSQSIIVLDRIICSAQVFQADVSDDEMDLHLLKRQHMHFVDFLDSE